MSDKPENITPPKDVSDEKITSKDISREPSSEAKNLMSLGINNVKESQDPPPPPVPPDNLPPSGGSPNDTDDQDIELHKAKKDLESAGAYLEDMFEFQESPAIKGISEKTKREYFKNKSEKIEKEEQDNAKKVFEHLRSEKPEEEEVLNAFDDIFKDKHFKKLNAYDSAENHFLTYHGAGDSTKQYLNNESQVSNFCSPTLYDDNKQAENELATPRTINSVVEYDVKQGAVSIDSYNIKRKFGHDGGGKQQIFDHNDLINKRKIR